MIGLMKEPTPISDFVQGADITGDSAQMADLLVKITGEMSSGGQSKHECAQLNRQGGGRFMRFARSMSLLGIIKKVPSASAGSFTLGLGPNQYVFTRKFNEFKSFYEACAESQEHWAQLVDDMDLTMIDFHKRGLELLISIGRRSRVCGLMSSNYVSTSILRKIVLAECAAGRWRQEWSKMTVADLRILSVDEGEHLNSVRQDIRVSELSFHLFGRTDWGLMVSCFACFWHDLLQLIENNKNKWGDTEQYEEMVSSEEFAEYVRKRNTYIGTTSAPINYVHGFIKRGGTPEPQRGLKRRSTDQLLDVPPASPRGGPAKRI